MNLLLTFFFLLFVFIFGVIPFWGIYRISDFVCFLLFKVFGYRKKVILNNLKETFTDKNESELKKLLPKIYKNLSDIIIESIKSFTMSRKQILKRHKVINPEILDIFYQSKQSVIAVTGHIGNWEWGSLSASLQVNHDIIALYKPLSNKWIDKFMRWSRARFGTKLVSIKETAVSFEKSENKSSVFLLAADQSPAANKLDKAIWVDFLGRETAFLHGPEKYAVLYNLPIIFIDIQRKKRGFYEIELSLLEISPRSLPSDEITKKFAKKLESVIEKNPSDWLWSHKRWKHKR